MEGPNFNDENPVEFRVWCTMVHLQDFMPMYTARANILVLGRAGALQSIKYIDVWRIHRKSNITQMTWIETITS